MKPRFLKTHKEGQAPEFKPCHRCQGKGYILNTNQERAECPFCLGTKEMVYMGK